MVSAALTFFILWSGKVNSFRMVDFVGMMGFIFIIALSLEHEVYRGSILLTHESMTKFGAPIYPITIPFVSVPYLTERKMIFSSPQPVAVCRSLHVARPNADPRPGVVWLDMYLRLDGPIFRLPTEEAHHTYRTPAKMGKAALVRFYVFLNPGRRVFLTPVFCAYMCPLRIIYDPPGVTTTFEWITELLFMICARVTTGSYCTEHQGKPGLRW